MTPPRRAGSDPDVQALQAQQQRGVQAPSFADGDSPLILKSFGG